MNYPMWDVPASGLLIAFVAIVHVFVSHFAVGGGLFLVLTERKARREGDDVLLAWLEKHSRFFILLTLVFGAVTGVGIWFTIALVHPAGTSSLINTFVWGWAIEWAFFLTEIAAAAVYYYGWRRLTAAQHLTVGWVYFVASFASLVVINGILSYMLTPGSWISTRGFMDGFFNPTYWPALAIRTLGAIGLAGIYALFTASWIAEGESRRSLARYAVRWWVLPMAIGFPIALVWYFSAAAAGGIPVASVFGASSTAVPDIFASVFQAPATGHPIARIAHRSAMLSSLLVLVLSLSMLAIRRTLAARVVSGALMLAALASIGSSEWVREDLRKPYVIGSHMLLSGIRLPSPDGSPASRLDAADPFRIDRLSETGVLAAAQWTNVPKEFREGIDLTVQHEAQAGHEMFRLLCSQCHTVDGYLAVRPLVKGQSSETIEGVLARLAVPRDSSGHSPVSWSAPGVRLASWRERRMPPFVGTPAEKRALAVYLATLGGGTIVPAGLHAISDGGAAVFENSCSMCHGESGDWPLAPRVAGRTEAQIYDMIGKLPELNEAMPPFEGTVAERKALAQHLSQLGKGTR